MREARKPAGCCCCSPTVTCEWVGRTMSFAFSSPRSTKYPDDLAIAYLLGTALIRQKRVEKGQVLVDRILRNGDSAEAHLMLGTAKMGVAGFCRRTRRIRQSDCSESESSRSARSLCQCADVYRRLRSLRKEFKAELAEDPYNFEANLQLGATWRSRNRITSRRGSTSSARGETQARRPGRPVSAGTAGGGRRHARQGA